MTLVELPDAIQNWKNGLHLDMDPTSVDPTKKTLYRFLDEFWGRISASGIARPQQLLSSAGEGISAYWLHYLGDYYQSIQGANINPAQTNGLTFALSLEPVNLAPYFEVEEDGFSLQRKRNSSKPRGFTTNTTRALDRLTVTLGGEYALSISERYIVSKLDRNLLAIAENRYVVALREHQIVGMWRSFLWENMENQTRDKRSDAMLFDSS